MKKKLTGFHIDGLLALLLFGIFAVCLLAVLLTGAGAYKRLTERDEATYNRTTCMQYIANRVRQASVPEEVSVEPFGDGNALVITDAAGYITRVYYYDGYLMELYASADAALAPGDGEKVLKTGKIGLSLEDGMLHVTADGREGESTDLLLLLTGGKEGQDEE